MEHAWRTALGRWGDELWGLALLGTGDKTRARHALVHAFERVYTTAQPATDAHTALLQALMPARRRWLPRVFRQRDLPPKLRRVGPPERMLLALWLLHGRTGAELARVAQISPTTLPERLARALVPFLGRHDIARRTKDGRAAFAHWLGQQLGTTGDPLPDSIAETTIAGWQQALNRVRDLLAIAVERRRMPGTVRDAVETALTARDDETPAWQRRLGFLACAALLVAVGWSLLRPSFSAPTTPTTAPSALPQAADAQTLAQDALDAWTTMPVSGTLHRRVWAMDKRPSAHDEEQITDVWLASDKPQYRVETTRDGKLVEWHVVDTRGQLHTGADAPFDMCQWSYGAGLIPIIPPPAQIFTVPPDQVRAIRDERLRSGTYGEGYRMLRRALAAPDLHSYGVRTEHERILVTLGFRDEESTVARTVLLLLDGRTHELQAVRELTGNAAQTTARDLWRVEKQETLPAVPAALPHQDKVVVTRKEVLDPACPSLDPVDVISLRRLATMPYGQLPVPTPLPANVVKAALIKPSSMGAGYYLDPSNMQVVLRSADGWLHISAENGYAGSDSAADLVQRGAWNVQFKDATTGSATLEAMVWQNMERQSTDMYYSGQSLDIEASGWSREQVLDLVDRLQFLDARTWPTLAPQFLDPLPLPADVEQVLTGAQHALVTLPNNTFHVTMNMSAYTGSQHRERTDPYHVPSSLTSPDVWTVEQWATLRDSTPVVFKQISAKGDGTLLNANVQSPALSSQYNAPVQQTVQVAGSGLNPYFYSKPTLGVDVARLLLAWDAPITMTTDGDQWRFEQAVPGDARELVKQGYWYALINNDALVSYQLVDDLPRGTIVQRVWLDRAQLLPRRWELILHRPSGVDTLLHVIQVREWSALSAALPDSFWTLPPLPSDTISNTVNASSVPSPGTTVTNVPEPRVLPPMINTVGGPIPTTPPKQSLAWHPDSGLTIEMDTPYRSPPTVTIPWAGAPLMDVLLQGGNANGIQGTGLVRFTRYRLPDTRVVTLTQGPRALLHYLLRQKDGSFSTFSDAPYAYAEPPQQSEAVHVTIAGEQHDAWLLRNAVEAALVVEIDDVLVHITGPTDYVGGVLLEQLPAFKWEPVILRAEG